MQRKTRRILLTALLLALAVTVLTRSRRSTASPTPALTAAELLRHAADNFATMRALYFTLTATPVVPGLRFGAVANGDGTVVWPDKLVFRGTMQSTPTLAAPVVIVLCGPDRYLELGDGNFMKMAMLPDVHRLLFAPDTGLVAGVLTQLEQVSAPEAATVADVPTWRLTGTVSERLLTTLPGRTPSTTPPTTPLRAELWIGQQDLRLHQAILTGPMFDGDGAQTTRTLVFSRFNENLPLTVPRGQSPCGAGTQS